MAILYIDNHSLKAKTRLIQQDKESYNLNMLLGALVNPIQEIENSFQDLIYECSFLTAVGTNLDNFGSLVGEQRGFRKDKEFRRGLLARIFMNKGGGTANELIHAIKLSFGVDTIEITNLYPACFLVFLKKDVADLIGIKPVISSISPLGVGDFVVIANDSMSGSFEFSECSSDTFNLVTDAQDQYQVIEGGTQHDLSVASKIVQNPKGAVGLSELFVNRYSLAIDGDIYVVDEDGTELNMTPSLTDDDDYTLFWEGGELAEIIK